VAAEPPELDPETLARWSREGVRFTLLDVRSPRELERAALPGALHVPMEQVQVRADEIPADRPVVVMCHHGGRSAIVARFLTLQGRNDVYNLDGGIDAYSRLVDSSIPRY